MNIQVQQFTDAMLAAGLDPGGTPIVADGTIHRFCGPGDKRGRENCWYVLFDHGGAFGSWRLGFTQICQPQNAQRLTKAQRRKLADQIESAKRKAEADRKEIQNEAAGRARSLWARTTALKDPNDHAYLVRKSIGPHCTRLYGRALCIPMYDIESHEIVSLQFIQSDGDKRFLQGGRVRGCYCLLPSSSESGFDKIAIAEGFATAASIQEATDLPVAVGFNSGNLLALAKGLRRKYRNSELILCADDDRTVEGNP